jgi:hypothetical protein
VAELADVGNTLLNLSGINGNAVGVGHPAEKAVTLSLELTQEAGFLVNDGGQPTRKRPRRASGTGRKSLAKRFQAAICALFHLVVEKKKNSRLSADDIVEVCFRLGKDLVDHSSQYAERKAATSRFTVRRWLVDGLGLEDSGNEKYFKGFRLRRSAVVEVSSPSADDAGSLDTFKDFLDQHFGASSAITQKWLDVLATPRDTMGAAAAVTQKLQQVLASN